MIEEYNPYIEGLLQNEPWRAGEGDKTSPCSGTLAYDGTRFWLCTCGRIGSLPFVLHGHIGGKTQAFFQRFRQALRQEARS